MTTPSCERRDSVIRAILRRERDGLPMNSEAVRAASQSLHSRAIRQFGSWRTALRAAGINPDTIGRRRKWGRTKIILRLRELCRRGRSLRHSAVLQHDSGLCRAACLTFGNWCNALVAAGINPESVCRDPQWDRDKIIEAILLRAVCGEALGSTTVRPHTLKVAAVRHFGSWPAALVAAGLDPADYIGKRVLVHKSRKKRGWSEERVRKAILQRHALGLPLNGDSVLRDDPKLYFAGRTWFKSWAKALADAGFDPARLGGPGSE
jgi:hypothetical protein